MENSKPEPAFKATLFEWLNSMKFRKNWKDYIVKDEEGTVVMKLFTEKYVYQIVAKSDYLGAQAGTRKPRAGEDHTRGNDLPDGPFDHETWVKILSGIVSYELVDIVRPLREEPSRIGDNDGKDLPSN